VNAGAGERSSEQKVRRFPFRGFSRGLNIASEIGKIHIDKGMIRGPTRSIQLRGRALHPAQLLDDLRAILLRRLRRSH